MLIHRFLCVCFLFLNLFIEQNNGPPASLAFAQVSVESVTGKFSQNIKAHHPQNKKDTLLILQSTGQVGNVFRTNV